MVSKVITGQELLKASGTVTRKLVRWLEARGLIEGEAAEGAAERVRDAARELPAAERLGQLLYDEVADPYLPLDPEEPPTRTGARTTWRSAGSSPGESGSRAASAAIDLLRAASELAQPEWSMFVSAARSGGRRHLLERGAVYP